MLKSSSVKITFVLGLIALGLGLLTLGDIGRAQEYKDPALEMRDYMVEISRHLGVTCTHCHNIKDFKSQEMPAWKVSKNHIDLVNILNQKHLDKLGVKKADCYLCHRGKLKPDYIEKRTNTD